MIIYTIENITYKYHNKIVDYIKHNLNKEALIDILIQNKDFHINRL